MSEIKDFITDLIRYLKRYNSIGRNINYDSFFDNRELLMKLIKANKYQNLSQDDYPPFDQLGFLIKEFMEIKSDLAKNETYKGAPGESTKLYESYLSIDIRSYNYLEIDADPRLFFIYVVLVIDRFTNYKIREIYKLNDFIDILEMYSKKGENYWFRGQSNSKWGLMPSYYRNKKAKSPIIINKKELIKSYDKFGLLDKYYNVFSDKNIDYNFLSYMQHAVRFSPLLDFTDSFAIATTFALSNKSSINDFYNVDSAVFVINIINESEISDINEVLDKDYKVFLTSNNKLELKEISSIISLMGSLNPNPIIHFINSSTNDRMRYQQGKFILFNDFTIYEENIPISRRYMVEKVVIKRHVKEEIYDYIRKEYPHFKLNYLMNPYLYFTE